MKYRSMADLIIIDTLRKKVDEVEEMNAELVEALAIIAEVVQEISNFTDNEDVIDIVEFLVAVATGDYEELYDVEQMEPLGFEEDDLFKYRS